MATLSGTIQHVGGPAREAGAKYTTAGAVVDTCVVAVTFAGAYVQGDNAQVLAVGEAIRNARHANALTIFQAMLEYPGFEGNNAAIIGAKSVAVSGDGLTCELTSGDLTTEHETAGLAEMRSPIGFRVLYTVSG